MDSAQRTFDAASQRLSQILPVDSALGHPPQGRAVKRGLVTSVVLGLAMAAAPPNCWRSARPCSAQCSTIHRPAAPAPAGCCTSCRARGRHCAATMPIPGLARLPAELSPTAATCCSAAASANPAKSRACSTAVCSATSASPRRRADDHAVAGRRTVPGGPRHLFLLTRAEVARLFSRHVGASHRACRRPRPVGQRWAFHVAQESRCPRRAHAALVRPVRILRFARRLPAPA